MGEFAKLRHVEPARLDRFRLEEILAEFGEMGAERMVGRSLDTIAIRLNRCERAWRAGEMKEVRAAADDLLSHALQIGLISLERAALNVVDAVKSGDTVAIGATVARMVRIGEASLMSAWDIGDHLP